MSITMIVNLLNDPDLSAKLNTRELKRIAKSHKGIYIDPQKDLSNPINNKKIRDADNKLRILNESFIKLRVDVKHTNDDISNIERDINDPNIPLSQLDKLSIDQAKAYYHLYNLKHELDLTTNNISEMEKYIDELRNPIKSPEEILSMVNKPEYAKLMASNYNSQQIILKKNLVKGMSNEIDHLTINENKYNERMDKIIPGLSKEKGLLPVQKYYDTIDSYQKQRIYDLIRKRKETKDSVRKLDASIKERRKAIRMIDKNIKRSRKSLERAGKKLESILPGSVSLYYARLSRLPNRRTIPGIDKLNRGERIQFSINANKYVENANELKSMEDELDKLTKEQSITEYSLSQVDNTIAGYNDDLDIIIPGSSHLKINAIKSIARHQISIKEYKGYDKLPHDIQNKLLNLIRLRNAKHTKIREIHSNISNMNKEIASHKVNVHDEFFFNAVNSATDMYMNIEELREHGKKVIDDKSLLWRVLYTMCVARYNTICIDRLESIMSPIKSRKHIQDMDISGRSIFISVTHSKDFNYIPDPLPSNVKVIEVQP